METRPIISGNFLKQPSIKKYKLNSGGKFKNSDLINNHGFFIGLPTNNISDKKIRKLVNIFEKVFKKNNNNRWQRSIRFTYFINYQRKV